MSEMVDKLIAKQTELGLNNKEFAAVLGVPRPTWVLTRAGKITYPRRVALAARAKFPDLGAAVDLFLLSNVNAFTAPAKQPTPEAVA